MTSRRATLTGLAFLASVAGSAGVAAAQQTPASTANRPASRERVERQIICRGAAIPAGWLLVDNLKDRTMCNGQNDAVYNAYNVWAIERFDNRSAGGEMIVCASSQTPAGWTVVDVFRKNDVCGQPSDPFVVNVKKIRRAR